jgi:hypothetical protein
MKTDDSTKVMFGGVYLFISNNSGHFPGLVNDPYTVHPDIHDIVSHPADPDKLYFITDGGLYRSDDFGNTFYDCNDGYVTAQVYIGSVSAQNSQVMLAGLQDNNTLSYFGSPYWVPVVGGDGSFNAIDPNDDYIQYASLQYLNIYKSIDQGQFFNSIFSHNASAFGGNTTAFIAPFALAPSNTNVIYAGADTIFKSLNGGISWYIPNPTPIDAGNVPLSIAVSHTEEDSVYICTAPSDVRPMHVYRSNNGGVSYTDISAGLPNRFPRQIATDPSDSRKVYIAFSGFGTGHLFKSTDAGGTWTDISTTLPDVPFHTVIVHPTSPDTLFAGSDLGVFVSADGGTTWDDFNNGLAEGTMVFDLRFSPSDNSIVAFTHGNGVYRTELTDLPVSAGTPDPSPVGMTLMSNPVKTRLDVMISANYQGIPEFTLIDLEGRRIPIVMKTAGNKLYSADVSSLARGCYIIHMKIEGKSASKKFVMAE